MATKFFVWPLGLWLAARRRYGGALLAAGVALASLLLLLPYVSIDDYRGRCLQLGRGFDQDSYTLFGLVVQGGASETAGQCRDVGSAALLLAATWRYRSFTLAIAAALDDLADRLARLLRARRAAARDRAATLLVDLVSATRDLGLAGAGLNIGDPWDITRLLAVFAVVLGVAFRDEPDRVHESRTRLAGLMRNPA